MSDELQDAMERVRASTARAIRRQLGGGPRRGITSPSDVLALLQADRERLAEASSIVEAQPVSKLALRTLTSSDPQPPVGTLVRDDCGREWENSGVYPCAWESAGGGDPESWVKVAGNYGPVTVIEWGGGE